MQELGFETWCFFCECPVFHLSTYYYCPHLSPFYSQPFQDQDFKCFPPELAQRCAEKCLVMAGVDQDVNVEDIPFNIEGSVPLDEPSSEGKPSMSSTSTVVTNTSSSIGANGSVQAIVPGSVKKDPPLKVVRTDDSIVNSEDETKVVPVGETTKKTMPSPPPSPKHPSSSFTDKLIKDAQSRQGRSLQRWLVHSPTESLVREVAGSIPITSDGRIVLVSASRKNEWILPKGGWDSDATKEECAVRETYEEAGLLGKLGSCLAPIDYESGKSKKRRLQHATSSEGLPPATKKAKTAFKDSETNSDSSPESIKSSFIRLILFPLYLTEVKSEWPEKGRLRKIVDIDEAIRIMEQENRLYFKKGLEMVKDMGLHKLHKN